MHTINNPTEQKLRKLAGNHIFSAHIVKKNGTQREMSCRFDVKKHLKGGVSTTAKHTNLVTVFDMCAKDYRSVNLDTATGFKINGKQYGVTHTNDNI